MQSISLTGLDAQNPLAFFASLGLLRVLDDHARRNVQEQPRLGFADEGRQVPFVASTANTRDELVEIVLADAASRANDLVLQLCYDEEGRAVPAGADGSRDLKPAPETARDLLDRVAAGARTTADLAAACFCELVQDNNGNTKPTAFHFTAGQQRFLDMVETLRRGIRADDVHEALLGPWRGLSTLPSLSWDATVARQYALRAGNPSKEKRGSIPAANWLGMLGLSYFPVFPHRGRLVTSGVVGGWKDSVFTWPTWSAAAMSTTVAALLRIDLKRLNTDSRNALGVSQVFSSRIRRSDQGGSGSFTPAEVVLPSP